MSLKERIYSVLVVSATEKLNTALSELLPESHYQPVRFVSNVAAAERAWSERDYDCVITSVGDTVTAEIVDEHQSLTEPPYRATLYQALIKGDKFDTVVQKAVECGVSRIVPVLTDRSVVRLDRRDCAKKCARWQRIADEAAKQCGRGALVKVDELMTFKEATADASFADVSIFCYEGEETLSLRTALDAVNGIPKTVSFIIGPEGGFSVKEADAALSAGLTSVRLGERILRTETAGMVVLSNLMMMLDKG